MRLFPLHSALIASIAVVLGLASTAEAQNPLNLTVSSLNGPGGERTTAEGINRGFSSLDCDDAAMASARVAPMAGTNITQAFVDLWMVTDSTDCSTTANRNPDTGTCRHVGTADINTTNSSFDVPLDLIDGAASSTTGVCGTTTAAGVTVRLFAFATGNVEDRGEVGDNWGQVSILVDPTGPAAPTIENRAAAGDNQVSLSWTRVADDNAVYQIYYRSGPCGGGGDGGTTETPDISELTFIKETDPNTVSTNINPQTLGVADGGSIEVWIVAKDQAGNLGEPGGPICVTRMQLSGFCDEFGDCDSSCAAGGVPTGDFAWPLLALGLLAWRRKTL